IQRQRDPSFFFTNSTEALNGEVLGSMNPLSNKSCNCFLSSLNSTRVILYSGIEIKAVLDTKSIQNSISLSSGNLGNSFGKTFINLLTIGMYSIAIVFADVSQTRAK